MCLCSCPSLLSASNFPSTFRFCVCFALRVYVCVCGLKWRWNLYVKIDECIRPYTYNSLGHTTIWMYTLNELTQLNSISIAHTLCICTGFNVIVFCSGFSLVGINLESGYSTKNRLRFLQMNNTQTYFRHLSTTYYYFIFE